MNNPSPFVSIFMMTYNHERYIAKALDSILSQKVNFDYEIVLGEDCSSDKTREIVLSYKRKYADLIKLLLHDQNLGASNNQIVVIEKCTGKYIAILRR
jgi:glycosyltransferase involved in cell wall biosynthesis